MRNVCTKCNKKLLQDFKIDYCYLCGAQGTVKILVNHRSSGTVKAASSCRRGFFNFWVSLWLVVTHNEGEKSPGRKKSLSTTEMPQPVVPSQSLELAKLEYKIKYKTKYKVKFEEKLKAQGLSTPTDIAPSGSVTEETDTEHGEQDCQ